MLKKVHFLIVPLIMVMLLVSCGETENVDHAETSSDIGQTEVKQLIIAENNETEYTVIRPMDASTGEKDGAAAVKRVMEAFTGNKVTLTDDYLYQNEKPSPKEILIGATNRQESRDAIKLLPESGYGVVVINDKIVICGKNDSLVGVAVDHFIFEILGYDQSNNSFSDNTKLAVPLDLSYFSSWASPLTGFNIVYPYGEFRSREYVSAKLLQEKIEQTAGIRLKVSDDYEETENEILVGLTKRTEAEQIYENINSEHFGGFARIGNKIIIFGITDSMLDAACDYFVNTVFGYDSLTLTKTGSVDYALLEEEKITYIDGSAGKVERLYNNILLPEVWPPHTVDFEEEEVIEIPYLKGSNEGGTHPDVVDIDVGRQLFVDDFLIDSTDLKTSYHTAVPDKNSLISFDDCLIGVSHGGLVFDSEENIFRMWFMIYNGRRYIRSMTSEDGIHWSVAGDSEPINQNSSYCTVMINPNPSADGSDKFVMLVRCGDGAFGWENHYETARHSSEIYKSSDGIKWVFVSESGLCGDATTLSYNYFRNKWVFCLRDYSHLSKKAPKRMVRYYECSDIITEGKFGMWKAVEWQRPDVLDKADPEIGCEPEFYNLCTASYESIQLGSFQYWLGPSNDDIHETGLPKITEIQMGYSRDGFYYYRPVRDIPLVACSRQEGTWDYGYLHSLSTILVTTDDELWLYYSAYKGGEMQQYASGPEYSFPSIGRAVMRRDGFASLDGSGYIKTCPLTVNESKHYLFVNAKAESLKAELIDKNGNVIKGFSADDCTAFSGDSCCSMLSWNGGSDVSFLKDAEFSVRFVMENGELYSFWLSENENGDSNGLYSGGIVSSK